MKLTKAQCDLTDYEVSLLDRWAVLHGHTTGTGRQNRSKALRALVQRLEAELRKSHP